MKFSVLLPTRNRLNLLTYAVETVRRQDYDDWEIIISDNYSEEDVAGYIQSLREPRIKYYRTKSFIPVTDNWNNALEKCTGDYIIMLGDDDGLMKGYFSTLNKLIEKFDLPDFLYTGAFLYAYPGVLPHQPDGFVKTYSQRRIFQSAKEPFLLEKNDAMQFVKDSLDFRVTFDYNMQFSLVSRKLIEKMKHRGPFYQSPYPDYYASNAMMLYADRILVVPQPLVSIGISPKSFGFYYFNDTESDGNKFLNNLPDQGMVHRLQKVILPGTAMNTSWLISMETLAVNFPEALDLRVNYARYRLLQIFSVYSGLLMDKEEAKKMRPILNNKMHMKEWLCYGLLLSFVTTITPKRYRTYFADLLIGATGSHPSVPMPSVEGKFNTMLDVFGRVDPTKNV